MGLVLMCALWPWSWLPYDPTRAAAGSPRLLPPAFAGGSGGHLLGTDAFGLDVLSVLIAGARATVTIVLSAALISIVLGVTLGLLAGYFGGWLDGLISRLSDVQMAFPVLVLLITSVAAFGPSRTNLILILGINGWATFARLVRAETLSIREREYIEAASLAGLSTPRILVTHILPNVATPVIAFLTIDLSILTLFESSLAYLGIGVQPPTPSWGALSAAGQQYIYQAPWLVIAPGAVIVLLVLSLNVLGDQLRDRFDRTVGERRG